MSANVFSICIFTSGLGGGYELHYAIPHISDSLQIATRVHNLKLQQDRWHYLAITMQMEILSRISYSRIIWPGGQMQQLHPQFTSLAALQHKLNYTTSALRNRHHSVTADIISVRKALEPSLSFSCFVVSWQICQTLWQVLLYAWLCNNQFLRN